MLAWLSASVCRYAAAACCLPCMPCHAMPCLAAMQRLSHSSRVLGGGLYGQAQVARDVAIQSDLRSIKQNLYCQVQHAPSSCQLSCTASALLRVELDATALAPWLGMVNTAVVNGRQAPLTAACMSPCLSLHGRHAEKASSRQSRVARPPYSFGALQPTAHTLLPGQ